jgi:AcrR family transcriptional regulator
MYAPEGQQAAGHDDAADEACEQLPRRKKCAEQTRRDILIAAGRRFARAGYAAVRLKDIADDVGVTAPLVIRYFGSKQALFREVARDESGPTIAMADLDGPLETLGQRLAAVVISYWLDPGAQFPSIALVRALEFDEAKSLFTAELTRRVVEPLSAVLQGPDAGLRASLIASQIMGFGMFDLGVLVEPDVAPPSDSEIEHLIILFGAALQAAITPA